MHMEEKREEGTNRAN